MVTSENMVKLSAIKLLLNKIYKSSKFEIKNITIYNNRRVVVNLINDKISNAYQKGTSNGRKKFNELLNFFNENDTLIDVSSNIYNQGCNL